jgi:hypothetical protein
MGGSDLVAVLGGGQCDARGGTMGGSPELSLALATVAPSRRGLLLCGLWRMGVLTTVFVGMGWVRRGLVMIRQT